MGHTLDHILNFFYGDWRTVLAGVSVILFTMVCAVQGVVGFSSGHEVRRTDKPYFFWVIIIGTIAVGLLLIFMGSGE
jgi:hypothetical protein